MTTVIRATLSVALRLIDTTTGKELVETDVRFLKDDNLLKPMRKGEGIWVFTNLSREDFLMHIMVRGYDEEYLEINYETLDPRLPMLDVFLMPSEKNRVGGSVLEICGTLSGLEHIEAINIDRPICSLHSFTEKRGVYTMTLLPLGAGGRTVLDSMKYAILSEETKRYDVFEVLNQDSQTSVKIKAPLEGEHKMNDKIYRIVYGRAGPEGRFSLKVRDDGTNLPYLVYFRLGQDEYFKLLDFHQEFDGNDLLKDAIKKELKPPDEEQKADE